MQIQQLHLLVAPEKEWRILKNFVMNKSKSGNYFTAMGLPAKRNRKFWECYSKSIQMLELSIALFLHSRMLLC